MRGTKGFFVKEQRAQHRIFNLMFSLAALKTMVSMLSDFLTLEA
jgi:hypothetical protein